MLNIRLNKIHKNSAQQKQYTLKQITATTGGHAPASPPWLRHRTQSTGKAKGAARPQKMDAQITVKIISKIAMIPNT